MVVSATFCGRFFCFVLFFSKEINLTLVILTFSVDFLYTLILDAFGGFHKIYMCFPHIKS